jgi:nicotinate-nucleotide adenylyltransferase
MRTVALYGGSFDPPHLGHEAVVKALLKLENLDRIIVMPTFLNPFKESFFAPAELRLEWLKEIFSKEERVEVSDFEVLQKRKVPTIKTLEFLSQKYEKIFLVLGADNLKSLKKWHRFKDIEEKVTLIVAARDKIAVPTEFIHLDVNVAISSSALREHFDKRMLSPINAAKIEKYYKENNERKN